MGQRILCYGDSNTYGYDSRSYLGGRYPKDGVSSPTPGSGMWSRAVPNEQKSPSCFVFIYRCQFFSSLKCPVIFSDRLLNFQCRKAPQTSLFAAKMVRPSGFEPLAFRLGVPRAASLPVMICAEIYQNIPNIRYFLSYNVRSHPCCSLLKLDGFRGSY